MKCAQKQINPNVPGCEYQVQVEAPPGGLGALGIRSCCWEVVVLAVMTIFHMKLKNACKKCNVLVSILYGNIPGCEYQVQVEAPPGG